MTADDPVDDGDVTYAIRSTPRRAADPDYAGLEPADVSVTNTDDDVAGITVSPTRLKPPRPAAPVYRGPRHAPAAA